MLRDNSQIETQRLTLTARTPEQTRAWVESLDAATRAEISPVWLARVMTLTEVEPWTLGFDIVLRATSAPIGSCGFKGPPDEGGMVEIAYGIDPEYRTRGYATEAAAALIDFASRSEQVRIVRAHTLSDSHASAHVLRNCGFVLVGQVVEPEDGLVWRWERPPRAAGA
jgi:[ribosomal protein S5]-alanine N-acetyltransferase